jgi:CHAT domain-containing protein
LTNSAAQSQLSALVLGGVGNTPADEHRVAVSRLEAEVERLQDAVSHRSAEFRVRARPVTIEQVQKAIPDGTALVEFFSYQPFDVKAMTEAERFGPARYVAYVLQRAGKPLFAELGEAGTIDADVAKLRLALADPSKGDVKAAARALDERVMRPVRKLLGNTRHVLVSPDGALNLVPFAALVDEGGKYLIESYSLSYLTSGRDLLRLQLGSESRQPPLVLADPLFRQAQSTRADSRGAGDDTGRRSGDMALMFFSPLAGTAAEAEALGGVLPRVRVLTQSAATESELKKASAPSILHIATHGFFLPDQQRKNPGGESGRGVVVSRDTTAGVAENPLLRSGLALEGANLRRSSGGEDGILTALEAAGLDLWGTKLVVLSACETGIGEVKNGEGVYGLRRALVLAGSESQVMTLWQVSDEATKELMVSYYKHLSSGVGRMEALRRVQLEMLQGGRSATKGQSRGLGAASKVAEQDYSHPYYWAAFIQSGDWRGMGEQAKEGK